MSKKKAVAIMTAMLVLGAASSAMASEAAAAGIRTFMWIAIACGFGLSIAAAGCSWGMGYAIHGALQGTARNPEAGGKIMTTMIIGLALMEALVIYVLLICFIMVFKIPDLGPMLDAIVRSL